MFSLVLQSTNWLKVGRHDERETWLKSPDTAINALGLWFCTLAMVKWMTSHAVYVLAEGGMYTTHRRKWHEKRY